MWFFPLGRNRLNKDIGVILSFSLFLLDQFFFVSLLFLVFFANFCRLMFSMSEPQNDARSRYLYFRWLDYGLLGKLWEGVLQ